MTALETSEAEHQSVREELTARVTAMGDGTSRRVGRDVPRYICHVTGHSELIERLVELDREHRLVVTRGVERLQCLTAWLDGATEAGQCPSR